MKTKTTLMGFAAAFALLTIAAAESAQAETWRMAHKQPAESIEGKAHALFAEKVAEYSNGALTVTLYPDGQLGESTAVLEQLEAGTIQVYAEDVGTVQKWIPAIEYFNTPFLIKNMDHMKRLLATDYIKGLLASLKTEHNLLLLGDGSEFVRGPYRVMVTKVPVDSADDVEGLKLRVFDNELYGEVWSYLGANVKQLDWGDIYISVDRGLVDALTSPMSLVESSRFQEVAPNIVRIDEYQQLIGYYVSARHYEALSPELQQVVQRAYQDAAAFAAEATGSDVDAAIARMTAEGATFSILDTTELWNKAAELYAKKAADGSFPAELLAAIEATAQP